METESDKRPRGNPNWQPGVSGNPGGRKRGEVYLSEAIRALMRGDPPASDAPVWSVARNVLAALLAERIDSRTLSIVLERLEGRVPDRVELTARAGVVLVPAERVSGAAWADLVRQETGQTIVLPAVAGSTDDEDAGA
jgi:hypothetical protein